MTSKTSFRFYVCLVYSSKFCLNADIQTYLAYHHSISVMMFSQSASNAFLILVICSGFE